MSQRSFGRLILASSYWRMSEKYCAKFSISMNAGERVCEEL
jgi:hypothetical protein